MHALILIFVLLPATLAQACQDSSFVDCRRYARYCQDPYHRNYLKQNCARTCNLCVGCKDSPYVRCDYYARLNYCQHPYYRARMQKNCPKSCNFCSVKPNTAPPVTVNPQTVPPVTAKPGSGKCGVPTVGLGRVIAGTTAKHGSWPWQALMKYNGRPSCGGSLVSSQWVITAAHCVHGKEYNPSAFTIVLGEHDQYRNEGSEQIYRAQKVISHRSFSMRSFDSDIAMIKLERPVTFDNRVSTVCLPQQGRPVSVGTRCYITGWGKTSSRGQMHHVLQQATIPIADDQTCNQYNQRNNRGGFPQITSTMVCAGDGGRTRKSGCQGDSGGPLVCRDGSTGAFELHGVVSFGSQQCSSSQSYTMFARVTALRQWIDNTMRQN